MILEKEDRKMTLRVDSIDPEKTKTPKKMNVGSIMYIGGLPQSGVMVPQPLVCCVILILITELIVLTSNTVYINFYIAS